MKEQALALVRGLTDPKQAIHRLREYLQTLVLRSFHEGEVERLRQRYGQLLRQAVAQTTATPEEIDAELRHLRVVLSR